MASDEPPSPPAVVRLEMALTPADFRRLVPFLPGAGEVGPDALSACGEQPGSRRWRITLTNIRARAVSRFSLPVADVEIALTGYRPPEAEKFLERFHLVFRRGGG